MFITAAIALIPAVALAIALRHERRSSALGDEAWRRLDAIAALEVHGREFVDAAELYKILGKPIPEPIDHAANIRNRNST